MNVIERAFWKFAPRHTLQRLLPPHATFSYSQEGEDRILARIFEGQGTGFYVDVGAFHPLHFSNTYLFYQQGWRGINIDARPGSMDLFKQLRPRDVNLELAVSDRKENLTYYEFNDGALNGFCRDTAAKAEALSYRIVGTREMQTVTLTEILDKYLPPGQEIDFLNVDAEGLDEQVLRSNNWDKYRPRIVLAEDLEQQFRNAADSSLVKMMNQVGYNLVSKTMNTLLFRRSPSE